MKDGEEKKMEKKDKDGKCWKNVKSSLKCELEPKKIECEHNGI